MDGIRHRSKDCWAVPSFLEFVVSMKTSPSPNDNSKW